jgi:ubiquinone biosynthesis protein UbiJ
LEILSFSVGTSIKTQRIEKENQTDSFKFAMAEVIAEELVTLTQPLETIVANRLERVKREQAIVLQKLTALARDAEAIEGILPDSDLGPLTDKINELCDRVDSCRRRVAAVSKRADALTSKLAKSKVAILA